VTGESSDPHRVTKLLGSGSVWKVTPQRVMAPYTKLSSLWSMFPSSAESGKVGVNLRGPPRKAKYFLSTDSELVP
jgi:hypothetical protein